MDEGTFAARAVISMSISLPSSSFRGFAVTTVALAVGETENMRRCNGWAEIAGVDRREDRWWWVTKEVQWRFGSEDVERSLYVQV